MDSNMTPRFLGLNNFIISIVFMKFSHILPHLTQNGAGQMAVYSKTGIIAELSINGI